MRDFPRRTLLLSYALGLSAVVAAQTPAAPTIAEQRHFLLTADIITDRPVGKGVTGTLRVTLSDGRLQHDASFQSVNQRAMGNDAVARRAGELNFVDSYKYNLAAYELAVILGLGEMMPVTVEREVKGRTGALSWWVDDYLMDELEREQKKAMPPDARRWIQARQRMFVFAELVGDTDRNKGNVIYTTDWRVIMIDFTRAFRLQRYLRRPQTLESCDRQLLARLQTLTDAEVKQAVGGFLTGPEVGAVMQRRDRIVEHYQRLIKAKGEAKILY